MESCAGVSANTGDLVATYCFLEGVDDVRGRFQRQYCPSNG